MRRARRLPPAGWRSEPPVRPAGCLRPETADRCRGSPGRFRRRPRPGAGGRRNLLRRDFQAAPPEAGQVRGAGMRPDPEAVRVREGQGPAYGFAPIPGNFQGIRKPHCLPFHLRQTVLFDTRGRAAAPRSARQNSKSSAKFRSGWSTDRRHEARRRCSRPQERKERGVLARLPDPVELAGIGVQIGGTGAIGGSAVGAAGALVEVMSALLAGQTASSIRQNRAVRSCGPPTVSVPSRRGPGPQASAERRGSPATGRSPDPSAPPAAADSPPPRPPPSGRGHGPARWSI